MNQRNDQKQETRRRILGAAAVAIQQRGLDEPSVAEMMKAAGLTVGGFYAHFESKDALLLEALKEMTSDRLARFVNGLPAVPGPERRALAARYYLSRKHRDAKADRCPLPAVLSELSRVDPRFAKLVAEYFSDWADALRDAAEPDGREKALAAIATMVGALSIARAIGPTPLSDAVLNAAKSAIG